jgi:hypothetical protein
MHLRIYSTLSYIVGILFVSQALAESNDSADLTVESPDKQFTITQMYQDEPDEGKWISTLHQGDWVYPLNLTDSLDICRYPATFSFLPNVKWLIRTQELGAGTYTVFLYQYRAGKFRKAQTWALGDAAWAFYKTCAESRKIGPLTYHLSVQLADITGYPDIADHPNSQIALALYGITDDKKSLRNWRCVFDVTTQHLLIPEAFKKDNDGACD